MLKVRVIPILTFNGFGLVKTKQFAYPRMVGNPVQAARVYNSRGVDELIFLDIFASIQNRKININVVKDVIKECFMPIGIGGGIKTIDDINDLLRIGADKVVLKDIAILNPDFVKKSSNFFGSQCISVAIDVKRENEKFIIYSESVKNLSAIEFIKKMTDLGAGEIILNAVQNDGMMNGFDIELFKDVASHTNLPIVLVGGGGNLQHFVDLFTETTCEAVGSSSIFHFTQYTPLDIKLSLKEIGKPVRI
ncbi:MAG: imidazole glycerol phosphate synthase subunit HisF [Saprospiraceae bacterium]|nr:imidazole glycerol phosphate synthase subunit HisF [Saprospiraceae bacterium]